MHIKPILDKVIVKPHEAEKQTSGGIILATTKNEGIIKGEVLAVGPGTHNDKGDFVNTTVPVGSTVIFNELSGQKFEHENETYFTLTESEIVAVLQ